MAGSVAKERDYKKFIHLIIMAALILFVGKIPPIGALTPLGMQTLGIFAGIVYGWSTLGMILPSMVGVLAVGFLNGNTVVASLGAAFGDRVTIILFWLFLTASLVEQVGLANYIAQWCVTRKFLAGRPWGIAIMFFLASAIIAATLNTFAAMILMCGIFYSFCERVGFKHGDKYPLLVLMGILYTCCVAGTILPFVGLAVMVVSQLQNFLGLDLNYAAYSATQLVMVVFSLSIYLLVAKYIFRPDTSLIMQRQEQLFKDGVDPLTGQQKLVGCLIILMIVLLFLPELLPTTIPAIAILKNLDIAGVVMLVLVLYYVIMLGHKDVVPFPKLAKDLSWDTLFLMATIAPVSKAISNPDAGILTFIAESMSSLLSGMSPFLFIVAFFIVSSIITQFANNIVVMSVVGPIMFTLGAMVGANPYVLTAIAAPFLSVAFATPAASVPAALAFSQTDWVGVKNAYMMGLVIFVINVLMMIIGFPVGEFMFGLFNL